MLNTNACEQLKHWQTQVVFSYLKNVKVESVGGINEIQRAWSDCDGELVVEDLAVQFSLEQLWLPGLLETS